MLAVIDTRNRTDGQIFLKPFDALSAVAHTASSIPEAINTPHSIVDPPTGVVPELQEVGRVVPSGTQDPRTAPVYRRPGDSAVGRHNGIRAPHLRRRPRVMEHTHDAGPSAGTRAAHAVRHARLADSRWHERGKGPQPRRTRAPRVSAHPPRRRCPR